MKRLLVLIALLLLPAFVTTAQEDELATRLFLIDMTIVDRGNGTGFKYVNHFGDVRNQVLADELLVSVPVNFLYYGLIPVALVAVEVSPAQVTYLSQQADVTVIPANLDTQITTQAQVNTVSDILEARGIPGGWVNVGDTYRTVLREISGFFIFMMQYTGFTQVNPFINGVNLGQTMGSVAVTQWPALKIRWAALKLEIDPSTITQEKPLGEVYGDKTAFWQAMNEATLSGMSLTNRLKMAIPFVADYMGYNTAGLNAGTTLRQVLLSLANQNDTRSFKIGSIVF